MTEPFPNNTRAYYVLPSSRRRLPVTVVREDHHSTPTERMYWVRVDGSRPGFYATEMCLRHDEMVAMAPDDPLYAGVA